MGAMSEERVGKPSLVEMKGISRRGDGPSDVLSRGEARLR